MRTCLAESGRELSVREVRGAIEDGRIRIDGRRAKPGERASGGESIDLSRFVAKSESRVSAEPELVARVRVVFRDERLLVLDKPSGMPVQPLLPNERGTLLGAAIAIAPEIADAGPPLEGGLVHRLDVDTSGLVVLALQADLRDELRRAFTEHVVVKKYLALVGGAIAAPCVPPTQCAPRLAGHASQACGLLVVEGAIAPGPTKDRVRVVSHDDPRGQRAVTEVELIGKNLARATTRYGRRHQVRAHLASIGLPILGDPIYGELSSRLDRLALHAAEIELPGFETFVSPLPEELARWVE